MEVYENGSQKAWNIYGTNLLVRATGTELYHYLYNGHADVTALITRDGMIAATYYYDAFGNILESTGNVDNSIRYAGYQYDEETGLYYINARMYDPVTARFLQEDTYKGEPIDPLSLNLYTYCINNPIIYIDPSGHMNVGEGGGKYKTTSSYNKTSTNSQKPASSVNYPNIDSESAFVLGFDSGTGLITAAANVVYYFEGEPAITQEDIDYNIKNTPGFAEAYYAGQVVFAFGAISSMSGGVGNPQMAYSTGNGSVAAGSTSIVAPVIIYSGNGEDKTPSKKGNTFRGGSKSSRDKWYGKNDKDFQKWWEKQGKKGYGRDIEDKEMADEVWQEWVDLGKPKVK